MKTVFLYTGQGSQRVGMVADFYEKYESFRAFVDSRQKADDLKSLMFEGPIEELSLTENTQKCMAVFAAGVTELLKEKGVTADAACGLSLGEYGALYAAGAFSSDDYVKLAAFRGQKMMEAARGKDCFMTAVLGMDSEKIRQICDCYQGEGYVTASNFNCPGQTVICGEEAAEAAVEALLKEAGAKRLIRLNVSGPFHTKFMEPAAAALEEYFTQVSFGKLQIPVTSNVTGGFYPSGKAAAKLLVRQVKESVHLEDNLRTLLEAGYENFIEIGPGNTMAGFLKKTAREMKCRVFINSIDKTDDFEKVVEEWKKQH